MKSKLAKNMLITFSITISVLVALVVGILLYFNFTNSVYLNAKETSALEEYKNNNQVFKDSLLNNEFVTYSYEIVDDSYTSILKERLFNKQLEDKVVLVVDKDKVEDYITKNNKTATKSKNAYIKKGKKEFKIVDEIQGTKINKQSLLKDLTNETRNLEVSDYYKQPKIKREDLQKSCDKLNSYVNWTVTYTNKKSIKSDIDNVDKDENNEPIINSDFIQINLYDILSSYNTVGVQRSIKSHTGKKIKVSGGTFGTSVNFEKEIEFLKEKFSKGKSIENREPEFSQTYKDIGSTYIEVDKGNQTVYVFKKNKIIMSSPCVTGQRGSHDTPIGVYFISECIPGKNLTGPGYVSWVNRWMRLTNMGVGLHDATWRSSFGGSIYTYNGSHGCINLPYSFACRLYSFAYVGLPVIIHY